ncbi:hypothetical protein [Roseimaritima ulvae]|uniref:hypothetical protein n=1 Tax=Roseimaritima ulvae TaxID=980254 RepID=UPI00082B42DE|nr:hypothetical protein [Roseimaritima ulvae]
MNLHSPLGSHSTHEEFQVDNAIVSIRIPTQGIRESWLAKGKALYYDTARRTADAIELAAEHTRKLYPSLSNDTAIPSARSLGLELRGVWVDPTEGTVSFDIYDPSDTLPSSGDDMMRDDVYSVGAKLAADGTLHVLTENCG